MRQSTGPYGRILGMLWRCPSCSSTEWWNLSFCSGDVYPQCKLCRRLVMVSSWSFVGATMQIKVSIGSCVRWVTFAWRLALFTLRVSVRGLSCRTAEACGNSTGAVLGLVATCPLLCRTAEARGDSTGAVLGLVVTCPLLYQLLKPVEIPQVQFLDKVVFMPVACRQFWGPDVQKTVVFHSCSLDKVADVPARAVHRRLWTSLCLAATLGSCWRCLRLSSSPRAGGHSSYRDCGFVEGLVAMRE